MKIFRQEVSRRVCDQCQKLHWHYRYSLDARFRMHLAVLTLLTLGLAWSIVYCLNRFYGAWRCKYCGNSKRELENATRPPSPGSEARVFAVDPVETEVQIQPRARTQRTPPTRRGSYSDSKAFLHRPKYGCSQEEYWAWHDTLYLGGSYDSPQWAERAREAKARDDDECILCGATENLETDHIIELSRGGSNDFDNLQTLCKSCHETKTDENRRKA
jgi:5-methylcytosine-specific restriction endonuclease McrA